MAILTMVAKMNKTKVFTLKQFKLPSYNFFPFSNMVCMHVPAVSTSKLYDQHSTK